jgi:tetratricopeptide (TPR) repeat protein
MTRAALIAVGLSVLMGGCAGISRRGEAPPSATELAALRALSQRAQDAYDLRDWPRAQAELERLVAASPRSAEAHVRLGRVMLAQARPAEAEAEFRLALTLDADYVDALIGVGQVALDGGRLVEALRLVDEAIELEPARPEAHFARGRTLEALGRPTDAQSSYFRALESDPSLAPASLRIAALQLDSGRLDQALVRLDQTLELVPDDADAHLLRGRAHLALGHIPLALSDLTFASSRLPDRPDAFYNLALALEASRKISDALKAAERAATLAPGWAEAGELSKRLRR